MYNEKTYYEESINYSTNINEYSKEEQFEIVRDYLDTQDKFFVCVDWSITISLLKLIVKKTLEKESL